jgi:hypothetical protein
MKKIVIVCLLFTSYVFAAFQDGNVLYDAAIEYNKLNNNIKANSVEYGFYIGYVEGVSDAYNGILFCEPYNTKGRQVLDIVFKYLKNNPEKRNKAANILILDALQKIWPCKNKK